MNTTLIGVPVQSRQKVLDRLTVPGVMAGDVARWSYNMALHQGEAMAVTEDSLDTYTSNAAANPYHQILATDVYRVGLGESDWTDIFKVFIGEVGKGVGTRIAGQPTTQPIAKPAGPPAWVAPVLIGSGVLLVGAMVLSARKRA